MSPSRIVSPPVVWPGDARVHWLEPGGTRLTAAARAFALAVAKRYGDPRDGLLSMQALNAINKVLGEEDDMDATVEDYLLAFNRGRFPAPARSLCADGYIEYLGETVATDFEEAIADMRKLHKALLQ